MKNKLVFMTYFSIVMLVYCAVDVMAFDTSELDDGIYQIEVTMEGGSGRASIQSPAKLTIDGGAATAEIIWSSPNYDYMIVDETKYECVNTEGNSTFEIPVAAFDEQIPVIGDTIAMSEPHEIAYTLYYDSETIGEYSEQNGKSDTARKQKGQESEIADSENTDAKALSSETEADDEELAFGNEDVITEIPITELPGLSHESRMELLYAKQFAVDEYSDGYKLLTIQNTGRFLLVPEGKEIPEGIEEDIIPLKMPVSNIYLVATSAMDFFDKLDALSEISLSGTNSEGWYIENAKKALENKEILYAGKYSAPDYEMIVSQGCKLALESTMIYHTPDVKEKLENLGVPVMVERSSYESHPLGRMEWIKFYGALLGREEQARECFDEQYKIYQEIDQNKTTDKTVAFFYINTSGTANIRKPGDYVTRMIASAGGKYVFDDIVDPDDNSLATMNITLEDFYVGAKDADYLIYNSTIDGELKSIQELIMKCPLLSEFKAVQEGNVWCTQKSLFQETMGLAVMMRDMHQMLSSDENLTQLNYMYRLQ